MSMNELFENGNQEVTTNARSLNGTAELTSLASTAATELIKTMEDDIEQYRDQLKASTSDASVQDKLIEQLINFDEMDKDFLFNLGEDTIAGMLKSQQSKRSRCKSKVMTLDNYRAMMTAAVAEAIIRKTFNMPKTSGGFRSAGVVDFTPAQLEALAEDQEQLRKEIRNIQSKKSIMKSKEGFDESSEKWQALLKAEVMLKDLRQGSVDTTKNRLVEMLGEIDIETLKAAESKDLLNAIKEMLQ